MTTERLIFAAGMAVADANSVLTQLWDENKPLDRDRCTALNQAALRLSCAAQELENRAAGKPPPQRG